MVAQTSWASEASTVDSSASFETEDTKSAKVSLDNYVFHSSGLPTIIGTSAALRSVLDLVRVVAPTDATVLINGETGTGKELIAEAIHKCSGRSNRPFVKVNCAAIPGGLLESELFGHERGAYTGAVARSIGRFERADGGTLFLDEVGDLPLDLQPKLLRVIQEREFERLGSAATIHTDVRVICATHHNLVQMINERRFRADLFYRLGVFPIELPPLRERPEDIRLLAHHFAMAYGTRLRRRITAISEEFIAVLVRHSWPGNVRELQNLIERSVILSTGHVLSGSLPEPPRAPDGSPWSETFKPVTLENAQRSHILKTLHHTKGRIGGRDGAAARLGLPRTTLIHRMKRLGIIVAPVPTSESIPPMPPPSGVSQDAARSRDSKAHSDAGRAGTLAKAEIEQILKATEMTDGLIDGEGGAAEILGIPPSTLRSRMKKLGVKLQQV